MNLTRLEARVLTAIRKACRPVTAAYLEIILDRRVDAALDALETAGMTVRVRGGYRAAAAPEVTERTVVTRCGVGFAEGYGWKND